MAIYRNELWIGELWDGGYHWEFKAMGEKVEDIKRRSQLCDDNMQRLKDIKEYLGHRLREVKDDSK